MQASGSGRRGAVRELLLRGFLCGLLPWLASQPSGAAETLGDDEFAIDFGEGPIGLDLVEVRFPAGVPPEKQASRVIIDAVKPGSQAETLGKQFRLRPQLLLVSVNGRNVEGLRAKDVIKLVIATKKQADEDGETMRLVFRDPLIFKEKLLNSEVGDVVATQVGVLGSEKLIVNVTKVPDECGAIRTQQGDVLEVKYTGYLAETMEVFDGSNINAQGNFFGDNSLYFVLNQGQRQAPRGWEVGLLGMCIGEERRLTIPPSLGYGKAGVPKGKIVPKLPVPPNAVLIYDVKLVGINGINVPTDDPAALGTRIPYDYQDCKKLEGRAFECGPDVKGRRL